MSRVTRKRGRPDTGDSSRIDDAGGLALETTRVRPADIEILEKVIIQKIRDFSVNSSGSKDESVYLKLLVGHSEASFIENGMSGLIERVKDAFGVTDLSISERTAGVPERLVTLNGKAESVARTAVYLWFVIGLQLNNLDDNARFIQKSKYSGTFLVTEHSGDILQRLEAGADEAQLNRFEHCAQEFFSLDANISTVRVSGSLRALFSFIVSCILSNTSSRRYVDDSKVFQIPFITANNAQLYQTQDINKDLLTKSNDEMIEYLYK